MAWNHILGHDRQREAFRHVAAKHRLAHAYLFVGPPGIGKRMFARELAKARLCEAAQAHPGVPFEACDRCPSCIQVDARTHPDYLELQRPAEKNEIPIALIRELCANLALMPARGHGKIAVLDDADDLNEESANSFLKTLEEPPPRSTLILIGTDAELQLATIRSRCQVIRFAPLPDEQVEAFLRQHEIQDPAVLARLVKLGAGSPSQALELADEPLWQFRQELMAGLMQPRADSVELGRRFVAFAEEAGKESAAQRRRAALCLKLLVETLADALRLIQGADARVTSAQEQPALRAYGERLGAEKILRAIDRCLESETQMNRYIQLTLVLEGLVDALVHPTQ